MFSSADPPKTTLTPIEYAYQAVLEPPEPVTYPVLPSIFSILSLLLMTGLSSIMLYQLMHPGVTLINVGFLDAPATDKPLALWTMLPFAFTIFGAGVGALFEIVLLLSGTPFQQQKNAVTRFVSQIRLINLSPVVMTILFYTACMVVGDPSMRFGFLLFAAGFGGTVAFTLFWGGANLFTSSSLLLMQAAGIALVLIDGPPPGGMVVSALLIGQALTQTFSLLVGATTPKTSTIFHTVSTISGVFLYNALVVTTSVSPDFSHEVAVGLVPGSLALWTVLMLVPAGMVAAMVLFPASFNNMRAVLSNGLWTPIWYLLVSNPRFPPPESLDKVYKSGKTPSPTALKPYYMEHSQYLSAALTIPAVVDLEDNIKALKQALGETKVIFTFVSFFDHYFPQARWQRPLSQKPRLPIWSSGKEFWPKLYTKPIFGRTVPEDGVYEEAPEPALDNFKTGQLLAYLAESGVASTMLEDASDAGEGLLKLDFRHLEHYDTKPDYAPYGGVAWFRIDTESERLKLVGICGPRSKQVIPVNPGDGTFRAAESKVLASMYFSVVSGKHLAEIHMTYNLVEVAMHNAFDAQGQWNHPFRAFMYLHFFAHELAEEYTTEHLVQDGAVFTQIFSLTHESLIESLNDRYHSFKLGVDEAFERRREQLSFTKNGRTKLLPNAAIKWELAYFEVWMRYTTQLVTTIYEDDESVAGDAYIAALYEQLRLVLVNGLPERYAELKTREGLARFAADTIHHIVVRHQVYGTTGVKAIDPRISKTQVPTDLGTWGVDEWRSLAGVALATARARFTLLMGNDFTNLLEGVDPSLKPGMTKAFEQLQVDLKTLNLKWTATEAEKRFNYDYFRPIPEELHTGAGY